MTVGDFAALTIPFQFGEDDIFGTGKVGTHSCFKAKCLSPGMRKLGLKEGT
jgi:hypothetical protein